MRIQNTANIANFNTAAINFATVAGADTVHRVDLSVHRYPGKRPLCRSKCLCLSRPDMPESMPSDQPRSWQRSRLSEGSVGRGMERSLQAGWGRLAILASPSMN
ncbi:hypothetical protein Pan189_21800 [Stratiformator vulcanicus]|uniref:Uncharacterized protein n=1 Tax=Stratiformator vulcanicus TaxID=2527980 RepID=A0A517R1Q0_9PLAN|nr:hypothetical protein Pan189_21800 [Stratiformator vulcanicus]